MQSRTADRERLERLLEWAWLEVERVDELSVEQKHAILLELGVQVYVYPVTAPERYRVEFGAGVLPSADAFWEGIEWDTIGEPTPEQRRETARIQDEERERGMEADLVGLLVSGGSPEGYQSWDYWDLHVQEALAQHAKVLGLVEASHL